MKRRNFIGTVAATGLALPEPTIGSESKGRLRPAICAYSFRDQLKAGSMTYADLIRMAADVGADGIDFTVYWLPDTSDQTLFPLKKLAYRSSVAIYTIGIDANMAQATPELRVAEIDKVGKWLDVAEKLGASHMRVFGGDIPNGVSQEQAVGWAVETLKRCADEAAKKGITLGVEDDGGITTNADRTVEIVKKTDSQWAGINLDIGNFPDDAYTQIEMCASYATNVHFKSEVHVDHKGQPVDIPRILRILGNAGYHGYLAIEYEARDGSAHGGAQMGLDVAGRYSKDVEQIMSSQAIAQLTPTRRRFLGCLAAAGLSPRFGFAAAKPLRGIFIILATPYTEDKAVDYEDLAAEVDFMARCGAHGMVWPQMASEYTKLTREERHRGMDVLAKAAKGKRPALVLGVQGPNTEAALDYARHAEELAPDALIAMPPAEAKSLDDFREYYRALARATKRPFFIQTTGGAKGVIPEVSLLVELAKEFPHFGYVKEEYSPVIERLAELAAHRPTIKGVFSGNAGIDLLYEMRQGFDGTMPGAPYADLYAQVWDLYQSGEQQKARDLFSKLLLMINVDEQIPGARQYMMKRRGVFKTTISRQREVKLSAAAVQEIEFNFEALKSYLRT